MKFTLSWLKDHLETDATLADIVERLTSIGLEVEAVDDKAGLKPFVIAKVLTAAKHPDADKLQVLTVDTGAGAPVQVVCGAPNARAGLIGAFAAPGTYVPGIDVTLSVGKIRGVESHGMMCSERELELSDEHNGIIDLPADAPVGTSFAAYAHSANVRGARSALGMWEPPMRFARARAKKSPRQSRLGRSQPFARAAIVRQAPETHSTSDHLQRRLAARRREDGVEFR